MLLSGKIYRLFQYICTALWLRGFLTFLMSRHRYEALRMRFEINTVIRYEHKQLHIFKICSTNSWEYIHMGVYSAGRIFEQLRYIFIYLPLKILNVKCRLEIINPSHLCLLCSVRGNIFYFDKLLSNYLPCALCLQQPCFLTFHSSRFKSY